VRSPIFVPCSKDTREGHPHQKPWGLTWALLESVVEPNDVVLDPCAGSLLVADVARQLGCRPFVCDLMPSPRNSNSLRLAKA
jgi:DNA modification methylase